MAITKIQADKAYEKGIPLITDEEYDNIFGKDATAEYIDENSEWEKIKHPDEGGGISIEKTVMFESTKEDPTKKEIVWNYIEKWMKETGDNEWVVSYKYDGISLNLIYDNGKLIHAITKGKAGIGEDILKNVLKMKNVKLTIPITVPICVKAEAIMEHFEYEKYINESIKMNKTNIYKNVRNGTTGACKEYAGTNAHYISLKYYGIGWLESPEIEFNINEHAKFDVLYSFNKEVIYGVITSLEDLKHYYMAVLEKRNQLGFDIDGLIITCNDPKIRRKLGRSASGTPNYSTALKFPYIIKQTVVLAIDGQMSTKGRMTPVARVKPVEIGGVTVSNITLKNWDEIKRLKLKVGDTVAVSRRGDVTPNIEDNLTRHEDYQMDIPSRCHICNSELVLDGPFLDCSNNNCESRLLGNIYCWIDKIKSNFGFKGIGSEIPAELYEVGLVKTPADLYHLTQDDLIKNLKNTKTAKAKKILGFQEFKEFPLEVFLAGLNIPTLGQTIWTLVKDAGYDTISKIGQASIEDLMKINGIGEERAKLIYISTFEKAELIGQLLSVVSIKYSEDKQLTSNNLNGKSFCITGTLSKSRNEFIEIITSNGGFFKSGVSSALNYLIVGSDAGSKADKAKKLNIQVINEEQFFSMVKGEQIG
jgi:DNA ligase (NAD+)